MNEKPKTMTDTPITRVMIGVATALLTAFIFGFIGFLVDAIRPDYFIIKLGGVPRAEFAALERRLTTAEARVIPNPGLSKLEVEQLLRDGVTELKIKERLHVGEWHFHPENTTLALDRTTLGTRFWFTHDNGLKTDNPFPTK